MKRFPIVILLFFISCKINNRMVIFAGTVLNSDGIPASQAEICLYGVDDMQTRSILAKGIASENGIYQITYENGFNSGWGQWGVFAIHENIKAGEHQFFQGEDVYEGVKVNLNIPKSKKLLLRLIKVTEESSLSGIQILDYFTKAGTHLGDRTTEDDRFDNYHIKIIETMDTIIHISVPSDYLYAISYRTISSNSPQRQVSLLPHDSISESSTGDTLYAAIKY